MRSLIVVVILFALSACGGGGSGSATPPPIPVGAIGGVGYDNLISGGTVDIYDYSTGSKGSLLGEGKTDSKGAYNINIQVESRPVLIELTGGSYIEEAGNNVQVTLLPSHKLTALVNYETGKNVQITLTAYTHLAAGLANYQISQGVDVKTAINDSNLRISTFAGVNIITTVPKQITDPQNISAQLTPELRYGFLSGAISMWTYRVANNPNLAHLSPYTSIDFAQLMYQDITADGLLDGMGRDSSGALAQLSFAGRSLGVKVYRFELGISIIQMAADTNNKTMLTGVDLTNYAQTYMASVDKIFNNVPAVQLTASNISISSPNSGAWLGGTITITPTITTDLGLGRLDLLLDNSLVTTITTNLTAPSFQLDTKNYPAGSHTIIVRATDLGGLVSSASVQINFDNTPPVASITSPSSNSWIAGLFTVTGASSSAVALTKAELLVDNVVSSTVTANLIAPVFNLDTTKYAAGSHTLSLRVTDAGGLVSTNSIQINIDNVAPVVSITSPSNGGWGHGLFSISATVSAAVALSKVSLLLDGYIINTTTSGLNTPAFLLNTSSYSDGVHIIGIQATDAGGLVTTTNINYGFDNTAPTSTYTFGIALSAIPNPGYLGSLLSTQYYGLQGCGSDAGSGIQSVTILHWLPSNATAATPYSPHVVTPDANGCWASNTYEPASGPYNYAFVVKDNVGICTLYTSANPTSLYYNQYTVMTVTPNAVCP